MEVRKQMVTISKYTIILSIVAAIVIYYVVFLNNHEVLHDILRFFMHCLLFCLFSAAWLLILLSCVFGAIGGYFYLRDRKKAQLKNN
jgi:H+/Cl- antiporter ClcA